MRLKFYHYICRVCGLAWKERGDGRMMVASCPRCSTLVNPADLVKESEESYGPED